MTCQYPEGFCWLTSHPNLRVGTDKRQIWHVLKRCSGEANQLKINKDFVQSLIVSFEEEMINKDFLQSHWQALQYCSYNQKQTKPHFYLVCHRHPTEKVMDCFSSSTITDNCDLNDAKCRSKIFKILIQSVTLAV